VKSDNGWHSTPIPYVHLEREARGLAVELDSIVLLIEFRGIFRATIQFAMKFIPKLMDQPQSVRENRN
jgi:hypothetical protein